VEKVDKHRQALIDLLPLVRAGTPARDVLEEALRDEDSGGCDFCGCPGDEKDKLYDIEFILNELYVLGGSFHYGCVPLAITRFLDTEIADSDE